MEWELFSIYIYYFNYITIQFEILKTLVSLMWADWTNINSTKLNICEGFDNNLIMSNEWPNNSTIVNRINFNILLKFGFKCNSSTKFNL